MAHTEMKTMLLSSLEELGLKQEAVLWQAEIEQVQEQARVEILVMGEFNHGKSSLINMLVDQNILRVAMTPTTQFETTIGFGAPSDVVRIHALDGRITTLPLEAFDEQKCVGVRRVEIDLASSRFGEEVQFVDTPGLNEAHALRETLVQELMGRASLVLFLLDASQPATRQEMHQIETCFAKIPPHKRAIVINKCDRLDADECLEVCAYVEKLLWPAFRGETFYFVSAKKKDYLGNPLLIEKIRCVAREAKSHIVQDMTQHLMETMSSRLRILIWLARALEQIPMDVLDRMSEQTEKWHCDLDVEARISRVDEAGMAFLNAFETSKSAFEGAFKRAIGREIEKVSLEDAEDYLEGFIASEYRSWMIAQKADISAKWSDVCANVIADMCFSEKTVVGDMSRVLAKHVRMASVETLLFECQALEAVPGTAKQDVIPIERLVRLPIRMKNRLDDLQMRAKTSIEQLSEKAGLAFSRDLGKARNDMVNMLVQDDGAIMRQLQGMVRYLLRMRKKGKTISDERLVDLENK